MDKTKLIRQLKKFEEHMMVDKGLCDVTVGGYCRTLSIALRRMRKFVPQYDDVKEYMLWMYKEKYSYSYIVGTCLALEHYGKFKGIIFKLGRPKKPRYLIKDVLSEAEVSRMVQAAYDIRVKALFCTLAYSGLRNAEVCNLRVNDVDVGQNQLRVTGGKNFKDRYVNIAGECSKILAEYLKAFPRVDDAYLFTTVVKGEPLATGDLRKHVRVLARRAEIGRRVYPHLLRHALATNLLNRGASLMMIKEQLGHVFYESTLVYAISMPFRTKSEYDFCKPAYL